MIKKQHSRDKYQKGIGHVLLAVLIVAVMGVIAFAAFKVGSSGKKADLEATAQKNVDAAGTPKGTGMVYEKGSSGCQPDAPVVEAKDPFTHSPLALDQVKVITNGKETNDPRFVYPWVDTAKGPTTDIFAPATGKLYMIRHKVFEIDGKKGNDYDMLFAVDCKTVYRFNHISNPRADIKATYPAGDLPSGDYANGGLDIAERVKPKTAIIVKAGEKLGSTTGTPTAHSFDFAVGISSSRESDKLAVCPLEVFKDPIKSQLLAKLGPKATYTPQPGFKCDVESRKF